MEPSKVHLRLAKPFTEEHRVCIKWQHLLQQLCCKILKKENDKASATRSDTCPEVLAYSLPRRQEVFAEC